MNNRVKKINEKVSILQVLHRYGYEIVNAEAEQQFSCDLHGDTRDQRPSARVYPDSNSWYCFACSKSRDIVETVKDKESCSFNDACYMLEEWYSIPHPLYRENTEELINPTDRIDVSRQENIETLSSQINRMLCIFLKQGDVPHDFLLKMWELHDMLVYSVSAGKLDEYSCMERLRKLKNKIIEKMSEPEVEVGE